MRGLRASVIAAAPLVVYGSLTAALSARQVADLDLRAGPRPDPLATLLESLGLLLALAAFAILGRYLHEPRAALRAGALAGALTGLGIAAAQSIALSGYLANAIDRYTVPDVLLPVVLALYITLATATVAVVGAAVAWLAARYLPRPATV